MGEYPQNFIQKSPSLRRRIVGECPLAGRIT